MITNRENILETRYFEKSDGKIHFKTFPEEGPWLTLVNGYTRSMKDFFAMAKYFQKEGFSVLVLDNRGSGSSESKVPFDLTKMAEDIFDLWNYLNIDSSHLLGISLGGRISQIIAGKYKEKVDSLTLVSTTAKDDWILPDEQRKWGNTLEQVQNTMSLYFSPKFKVKNKLLIDTMAKNIYQQIEKGSFNKDAKDQRNAMSSNDSTNELTQITCNTLILHGKEDKIIQYEASFYIFQKIKTSELQIYPEIGHLFLAECPKKFYRKVLEFIRDLN